MAGDSGPHKTETDPYLVLVGQAFRQLRGERKVDELVKAKGGLNKKAIEKIEKGQVDTTWRSHQRLALLLNTTLDDVHRIARSLDTRPTWEELVAQAHAQDRPLLEVARFYGEQVVAVLTVLLHQPPPKSSL